MKYEYCLKKVVVGVGEEAEHAEHATERIFNTRRLNAETVEYIIKWMVVYEGAIRLYFSPELMENEIELTDNQHRIFKQLGESYNQKRIRTNKAITDGKNLLNEFFHLIPETKVEDELL